MKTLVRLLCISAVMGGLPAAGLFGQIHYLEDSPISASGDAASEAFETSGQLSSEELSREFGSDATAASTAGTTGAGADGGTQQQAGFEVGGGSFEVQGQETDF